MSKPLADRMRPETIEQMSGQQHLIGEGMALRQILDSGTIPNLIFYGPSGVGKTTLAEIIAKKTEKRLYRLNATNTSLADIKDMVSTIGTFAAPKGILLYLDEIQYFNKKQQQSLLEYLENGDITMIASTTENPHFYIYNAVISRCTVFEFKPLLKEDVEKAVKRGFSFLEEESGIELVPEENVVALIAAAGGGDVRKSLNILELSVLATKDEAADGKTARHIQEKTVRQLLSGSSATYDRKGDDHYDLLSAFQKSMRGSDPDAAIHYLARILEAGDMPSAIRRLLVTACEDVGLAYPGIIPIVKSACEIAERVGMPEARIPLANAVILVCNSPKSNAGYKAYAKAEKDIRSGNFGAIPRHLRNSHFDGEDSLVKGQHYLYPHDFRNSWVEQQYLPDVLKNASYYEPGENKMEKAAAAYWKDIKKR